MLLNDLVEAGSIGVDSSYKELRIIKLADRQIIDFGEDRYWTYGLSSQRHKLHLLDKFYALRYGNIVKDWHINALFAGPAAMVALGSLLLGYSIEQSLIAGGGTAAVIASTVLTIATFLTD